MEEKKINMEELLKKQIENLKCENGKLQSELMEEQQEKNFIIDEFCRINTQFCNELQSVISNYEYRLENIEKMFHEKNKTKEKFCDYCNLKHKDCGEEEIYKLFSEMCKGLGIFGF